MERTYELAGFEVPRIGLGTNRLRDTDEGVAFIRAAVEAGVRHIDTAHLYTGGASERAIGWALEGAGTRVLVATKGGYRAGEGRPDVLRAQLEQSLSALGVDAIDLYYLHRVDPETPLEESLGALGEAVESGLVRNVGLSEVGVGQIEHARALIDVAAVQNRYNLDDRSHDPVIDYCAANGIAFVPYFPLAGGSELAPVQRLARLLERAPNVLPIPGTLSVEHVRKNLSALDAG